MLSKAPINNPFVTYLFADESIVTAEEGALGLSVDGTVRGEQTDLESMSLRSVHAFTDRRVLTVTGSSDYDTLHSIPYNNITNFTASSGGLISSGKVEFQTPNHEYILTRGINSRVEQLLKTDRGEDLAEVSIHCDPTIVCTKCHEQVGEDAERCPHCGYSPDDRNTIVAVHNHPVGVCAGYEYVELENAPSKLEWFEIENAAQQTGSNQSSSRNETQDDPYEKLRKLEALYDDGVLSEQEFESKKQDILNEL